MKTKNLIYLVVGAVVLYLIWKQFSKDKATTPTTTPVYGAPGYTTPDATTPVVTTPVVTTPVVTTPVVTTPVTASKFPLTLPFTLA